MHLSRRLKRIIDNIDSCRILCDIGCDHGKLGCYAVMHGIADFCISADISSDSLAKAYRLSVSLGIADRVKTVLSDGFSCIYEIPDVTVISGMGGRSVIRILNNDISKSRCTSFVMSPQSEVFELRSYLAESGFAITRECVISENGKYYPVIVCHYCGSVQCISGDDLQLGVKDVIVRDKDYRLFIEMLVVKCRAQIAEMIVGGAEYELIEVKKSYLEMLKGRLLWLG